ncbi:hypothetical protein Angca_009119, partial [Angiostrongylus cantonensis]
RWYFNPLTQQCLPCTYRGLQGNENNFLTRQECESSCLLWINPCAMGQPILTPNQRPFRCHKDAPCSVGYYCHIGFDELTTACCPSQGDSCTLEVKEGRGIQSLSRWFYNRQTRQCQPFTYRGMRGNANNFLTRENCEQRCPVLDNPCALGLPQMTVENRPQMCSTGQNTCSAGYWCHYGATQKTTVCCPGRVEGLAICQQSLALGNGDATLARWYYDAASMRCVQFYYRGHYGNQNNFLTLEECERTCPVFVNPCNQPIPLPPRTCSAVGPDTCGPSSWCHVGATPDTTICCPSEGDPCTLPLNRGTGNQYVDRWYFNQQAGTCQPFLYAGLHGNQNNFLTREACEERCGPNPCFEGRPFVGVDGGPQTCSISANLNTCPANYWCHIGADMSTTVCCPGASTNICNLPMSTGEGNYNLERYYFDQSSKTCRPFIYNGLKGNQNNFITLRACQLACQPLDNPCIGQPATTAAGQVSFSFFQSRVKAMISATNACSVPLAPGTGNAGLSRWYYNPDDRQCLPFQYNGKRGNQNNFETQAECERTCPVIMNPCLGKVHRDENGTATGCNPMTFDQCPNGFFCLAGDPAASNTSYCCPRLNENICDSSWSEGEGDDSLDRFYYDSVEGECYPFTYKGRRGNENNFLTKRICEETCKPSTIVCFGGESPLLSPSGRIVQCHSEPCPGAHYCHQGKDNKSTVCCMKKGSPCDQQLMLGIGDTSLPRFYYDPAEDDCLAFNYTGLGGNENNFVNRAQCQIACPGYRGYCPHGKPHMLNGVMTKCAVDTKCPSNYICHISKRELKNTCCPDPEELCLLSIDRGACGGRQTRYAFNRQTSQCTPFDYTGCGGNLNNFVSMMDCMATCGNVGFRR